MPLDRPQNIPNSSLSTPYITVNSDVAELGNTIATFYSGATAQRPTTNLVIGDQFYNTQLKQLEIYTENGWVADSTAPQAPTNVTASNTATVYGSTAAATVKWIPATLGAPASSYTVTSTPGSLTNTVSQPGATVTGLTAGTSYTFTVTATNTYGSATSTSSLSVTAGTVSQAPNSLVATNLGATSVSVAFNAPSNIGATAITSYNIYSNPGNIVTSGTSSPIIINGLTTGQPYTFTAVAINSAGISDISIPSNPVTPASIELGGVSKTSLHSWYDASNSVSVIKSGSSVTQWNDLSGNNRNATVPSGGSSPTTGINTLNGKNVINFNGSTQLLTASASITSNVFTYFCVYLRQSGGVNYGRILSLWNSPSGNDYGDTSGFEVHASAVSFLGVTPPLIGGYRNGAPITANAIAYNTNYLFSGQLNGATFSHNNGGSIQSGSTSATAINSTAQTLGAGGPTGGGDQFFTGYIAEHIIWTRILDSTEIAAVRAYLSNKWGVS